MARGRHAGTPEGRHRAPEGSKTTPPPPAPPAPAATGTRADRIADTGQLTTSAQHGPSVQR